MDSAYVATHVEEDRRHWWFLGRQAVLRSALEAAFPQGGRRLVEIGCGTGAFLPVAAKLGEVVGVEASPDFREAARRRGFTVLPGSLPDRLPPGLGFVDGVLLFDVLEHIEEDREALRTVAGLLRPGGLLICTVPAYPWLWSPHDEALGHRRRYTRRGLSEVARAAGLRPLRVSHFNTLLAPPIVAVRLLRRWCRSGGHDLTRPARPLNALLTRVFSLEAALLRWTDLPFGVSILMVARR